MQYIVLSNNTAYGVFATEASARTWAAGNIAPGLPWMVLPLVAPN